MTNETKLDSIIIQLIYSKKEIAIYESMKVILDNKFNFNDTVIVDVYLKNGITDSYVILMNNTLLMSLIRLATVIGTNNENLHWKKTIIDCSLQEKVLKNVFIDVFGTKKQWENYHKNLVGFRNNYIVHHSNWQNTFVPYLDKTKLMIDKLIGLLAEFKQSTIPIDLIYENQKDYTEKLFSQLDINSISDIIE